MRIVTWNVARRHSRLAEQAAALAHRKPDVVALQEITARTLPLWRAAFATLGLSHVWASLDSAEQTREPATRRRTGVVLASRRRWSTAAAGLAVPWSETATSAATAAADAGKVDRLRARPERCQRMGQGRDATSDPQRPGARAAWPTGALRGPQHPTPRAPRWRSALIRARFPRASAAGPWTRVGRGGARCGARIARPGLPGHLPSPARIRASGAELDVAARSGPQRWLATRSPIRIGGTAPDGGALPPRLARRGSE